MSASDICRRHGTVKIERKPGLEIHVSALVLFPDEEDERYYLEIREWNTEAEIYGHGLLVPMGQSPELERAIAKVVESL